MNTRTVENQTDSWTVTTAMRWKTSWWWIWGNYISNTWYGTSTTQTNCQEFLNMFTANLLFQETYLLTYLLHGAESFLRS